MAFSDVVLRTGITHILGKRNGKKEWSGLLTKELK